mmetsp:Transcript_14430/g.29047  ORF Transcript_14430/g.29047 Transcript_14430/m.29047 type:complete len:201 (-) Transcript_14430:200-802(-)
MSLPSVFFSSLLLPSLPFSPVMFPCVTLEGCPCGKRKKREKKTSHLVCRSEFTKWGTLGGSGRLSKNTKVIENIVCLRLHWLCYQLADGSTGCPVSHAGRKGQNSREKKSSRGNTRPLSKGQQAMSARPRERRAAFFLVSFLPAFLNTSCPLCFSSFFLPSFFPPSLPSCLPVVPSFCLFLPSFLPSCLTVCRLSGCLSF